MVEPLNSFSKPVDLLRSMVANSVSFQTWVGAVDDITAKAFIHLIRTSPTPTWPLAIIDFGDEYGRLRESGGSNQNFQQLGSLLLMFEMKVVPFNKENWQDAALALKNQVGLIIDEIEAQAGQADKLSIKSWELKKLERTDEDERGTLGDLYTIVFEIDWGP